MDIFYVFCFVLPFLLITQTTSTCFNGTTSGCQFQCHCVDDSGCVSERSLLSGNCPSGCTDIDAEPGVTIGDRWSGPGCQIGNIANSTGVSYRICNLENQGLLSLVDKSIDGNGCLKWYISNILEIKFDSLFVIYNISINVKIESKNYVENIDVNTDNPKYMCSLLTSNSTSNFASSTPILSEDFELLPYRRECFLCEIIIIGYQYVECELYNGDFYYGPGCLLKCENCDVQCDMINGDCPLYTSTPKHEICMSGYWGDECENVCNCRDESCLDETGECPLTGCAEGYIGTSCDHLLPNLNGTTPSVEHSNSNIIVSLQEADHLNLNTLFALEYGTKAMEWKRTLEKYNITAITSGLLLKCSKYTAFYYVRIIPFDLIYNVFGKPSKYVHVDIVAKCTNEQSNEKELQVNESKKEISQTMWIIYFLITFSVTLITTSVICILKQRCCKSQQSNMKRQKDKTLEIQENCECSKI